MIHFLFCNRVELIFFNVFLIWWIKIEVNYWKKWDSNSAEVEKGWGESVAKCELSIHPGIGLFCLGSRRKLLSDGGGTVLDVLEFAQILQKANIVLEVLYSTKFLGVKNKNRQLNVLAVEVTIPPGSASAQPDFGWWPKERLKFSPVLKMSICLKLKFVFVWVTFSVYIRGYYNGENKPWY